MTNLEYLQYCIRNELIYKIRWFFSVFVLVPGDGNGYLKVENGAYKVLVDETYVTISGIKTDRPLLRMLDVLEADAELASNIETTVTTTVGRLITNKLLLSDNFGNKIPYINDVINIKKIESIIAKNMHSDGNITVEEYLKFVDAASFIQELSRITTISATEKSLLPPKGIKRYKKELIQSFNEKYGSYWTNDRSKIVEFENSLKDYDKEWMKGDPTDGKIVSGKVVNARSKMFLTFGAEAGFDKKGLKPDLVIESLSEEYPSDINKLTTMFNTSRAGSYDRGKETQKGGAAAKDVLRATSSLTIVEGDCGSKLGKLVYVNPVNMDSLIGRHMFTTVPGRSGMSTMPIKDPAGLLGKVVMLRSPMYCKKEGSTFCAVCAGEVLSKYATGISLLVTDISGILLNSSMKSMHTHVVDTMNFVITDAMS